MHENAFCQSFNPPARRVFGVRLDKYAIGHEIALVGQGNPLVTYTPQAFDELDSKAKKLALGMALELCGKLGWFKQWLVAARISRAGKKQLAAEIQAFRDYRNEGSQDLPVQKMPRQQGVPFHYFGAPELARLLNYVTAKHEVLTREHFGGSPVNFPLGLAQILYSTHLESEGSIWVKNHQDMERDERIAKGGGSQEKVLTGEAAEKAFAEIVAAANKKETN
jgi:hypothetical protein